MGNGNQEKQKPEASRFSSGFSSKPSKKICVAGLLTYFRYERLPNSRQWPKRIAQPYFEAYSSGTVRDSHPIPF